MFDWHAAVNQSACLQKVYFAKVCSAYRRLRWSFRGVGVGLSSNFELFKLLIISY